MGMPEIKIYGDIGDPENGITAKQFQQQLDALGDVTEFAVRIASDGGSVPDGIAIHNAIKNHPARTTTIVESALSIASYIAVAGDDREIAPNGMMLLHGARTDTYGGTESDHEQRVAMLKTANQSMRSGYMAATGRPESEIAALLAVDTWMDADQALAEGLVTRIGPDKSKQVGAGLSRALERFPAMPPRLVAMAKTPDAQEKNPMSSTNDRKPATVKELKAAFPKAKAEFILAQAEKESTVEEARASYVKAMEEELETANATIKAMTEEQEAKARAMEEEEKEAAEKATEEEEKEVAAKAKSKTVAKAKSGVKPVAKSAGVSQTQLSAHARWNQAIDSFVAKGLTRQVATIRANRANPGLREELLEEANA